MSSHATYRSRFRGRSLAVSGVCCVVLATGCASWQGPRIDPSGERLLIWPNQAPVAPTYAAPFGPAAITSPPGNIQAQPVYPDAPAPPVVPVPATSTFGNVYAPLATVVPGAPTVGLQTTPLLVPAAPAVVPTATAGVATPLGTAAPVGHDYLRLTPDRILAPVGSEVVLKAGICTAAGYLLANQRVEWLLSPGGTGQFVDLAERDQVTAFRWLWDTPRKLDNSYAITSTSWVPTCLRRGTPDPSDDVQILKGDAWVSVTSATEGASYVTAYTPAISDWNLRRATATIYWIDAQWVLPASAIVNAGRPHVLTTTLTRRTDGVPLNGWLVRYETTSGASLGYGEGNVVEVPTDAGGRASVEITPTGLGGGSTTVGVTVVRPPQTGPAPSPRLEVGRGVATITWSSGAIAPPPVTIAPGTSMPTAPFSTTPIPSQPGAAVSPFPATPPPNVPNAAAPTAPYTPPPDEPPPGRSQLQVRLERTTPERIAVGDYAGFRVTITNVGDGTARRILIRDAFDRGLRHEGAQPNEFAIEYAGMRDLPPGESESIPLTFQVVAEGTQCHVVSATAEGARPVSQRGCITGQQAALEVRVTGPRAQIVGELAEFRATIKNTGDVAAKNVEIVVRCDPALEPTGGWINEAGHERLGDGSILIRVNELSTGEVRTFQLFAQCRAPNNGACCRVTVTAEGGVTAAADTCVEILPPPPSAGAAAAAPNLRLTVVANANPVRAGANQVIYVSLVNAGAQAARDVAVSVLLPQEMKPDASQIQPRGEASVSGQEIRFAKIAELQPQGELRYIIPVTVSRGGEVQVRAAATAEGLVNVLRAESNVIQILPQ